jgi:ribosomal protein S18 acetylase RimI-like enzyme
MPGDRRLVTIERLAGPPRDALDPLIAESEQQGLRLVRRLADEWASGANRFDRSGEALFVARIGGTVVGVCGLNVDPYAGAAGIGRVRHLYVLSAHRGVGVGERLVTEVIAAAAAAGFETLRLRTQNPTAARLYERMGFRRDPAADCSHVMALGES